MLISLDDYFVDRDKTPRDADGEYDYEALEAIDLELFNDHLQRLYRAARAVDIPRYDFITGNRQWHDNPLAARRAVGADRRRHPRTEPAPDARAFPNHMKFKIYISCFTSVSMDNLSRIATTDNRLLRRLARDYTPRGATTRWRRSHAGRACAAARRSTSSPIRRTPT